MSDDERLDPSQPVDDRPTPEGAPRPKKKSVGPYRLVPREDRDGLVLVYTGEGKGKTTAALGLLLRARGWDMEVAMLQFIKSKDMERGEHVAARELGVEIDPLGDGFTWNSDNLTEDREFARECWEKCHRILHSGEYDVVIFDELTYTLAFGWLSHEELFDSLSTRPEGTHVVITGRRATSELKEYADLVTEMREVKHPYRDQGIGAQPGVDL